MEFSPKCNFYIHFPISSESKLVQRNKTRNEIAVVQNSNGNSGEKKRVFRIAETCLRYYIILLHIYVACAINSF